MTAEKINKRVRYFRDEFYELVQQIPYGRVSTYGALARALGDVRASRTVGKLLNENPRPIEVPCHRVVMSQGELGGFGLGLEMKRELLANEGISLVNDMVFDFHSILYTDFESDEPLKFLREEQRSLARCVRAEDDHTPLETVGGLDVAYHGDTGYATLSVWSEGKELRSTTIRGVAHMPYIPTYLSFREMPLLLELLEEVDRMPDMLMVDGNGIMHPRGLGLASHLGVVLDIPTIGVAKSMLCGRLEHEVTPHDPVSPVTLGDTTVGYALLSGSRTKKPIYISPGHRVSPELALETVMRYCSYKLPEPVRQAHITSTKKRNEERCLNG